MVFRGNAALPPGLPQDLPLRRLQQLPRLGLEVLPQPLLAELKVPGVQAMETIYIYIYIYREREREREIFIHIHIRIHIDIDIEIDTDIDTDIDICVHVCMYVM